LHLDCLPGLNGKSKNGGYELIPRFKKKDLYVAKYECEDRDDNEDDNEDLRYFHGKTGDPSCT
jgi:hypothetical protein